MTAASLLSEMQARLSALLAQSPAKDIEQNLKALMQQGFERLDLASREQLDLQADLLARAQARLSALEQRVAELEAARNPAGPLP